VLFGLLLDSRRWHLLLPGLFWFFKEGCAGKQGSRALGVIMSNVVLLEITLLERIFSMKSHWRNYHQYLGTLTGIHG
jgi:hypothetical protein